MKFEKLSLKAFSKEKLTENGLRSINGGAVDTCNTAGTKVDSINDEGCTHYIKENYEVCDSSGCG